MAANTNTATEQQIQRGVLDYLELFGRTHNIYYFRSAAGHVKLESGRMFKTGRAGTPDISCVYNGSFYGLEIKTATGRQSALQKLAEQEIIAAGGKYLLIRSLDDIRSVFPL